MKQMTEQHLISGFGGESQVHMRYLHFAHQADKRYFPMEHTDSQCLNMLTGITGVMLPRGGCLFGGLLDESYG